MMKPAFNRVLRTALLALAATMLVANATPSLLFAQDATETTLVRLSDTTTTDMAAGVTYRVTSVSSGFDAERDLHRDAMTRLEEALRARGFVPAEHPEWTFAVAVRQLVHDDDLVAFSVVASSSIPETVVEWAKEAQVFYAGANLEDLPAEGRFIREYVSEDFIRGYGMLQDHEVVVVNRSDLIGGATSIVNRFVRRHLHFQK